jgi:hypothetical protein
VEVQEFDINRERDLKSKKEVYQPYASSSDSENEDAPAQESSEEEFVGPGMELFQQESKIVVTQYDQKIPLSHEV